VLIAGGADNTGNPSGSAELYQPATLTPPGLVSIALAPANPSLTAGVSQPFTATGTFTDNSTQTLASATWSSSNNSVATVTSDVSNFGGAYGFAPGSATVSACTGSVCGSATITVASAAPLPPAIVGLAPGSASVGSWVAISGSNFGPTQGSSTVTFGGVAASIVGWSDTAIFATVPSGLVAGQTVPVIVTATAGASNPADFISLATSTIAPFQVSPQEVNLLVGQTRIVSVMDSSGNILTGLEWSTSNPAVVSLSTDDPPVLTGVAPGTAIVYVVGMPILVTVYSGTVLPAGTPIWSVPLGGGSGAPGSITIAPAVPSASGVDLFAMDATTRALTALASDGTTVWKSGPVGSAAGAGAGNFVATSIIPDFSGNAVLKSLWTVSAPATLGFASTHAVQSLNPATGQATNLYTFSYQCWWDYIGNENCGDVGSIQTVIPHPAGLLFIQDNGTIILMDPSTGQQIASVALPVSARSPFNGSPLPVPNKMIVAGDGNAYVPYGQGVLRFSPDGSNNQIGLGSAGATYAITNGANGVAVFGSGCADNPNSNCYTLTLVSSDTVTAQNEFVLGNSGGGAGAGNWFSPTLQREDGSYIGADLAGNLYAIGLDGTVLWQQQITASSPVYPLYATADGGVIVTSTPPACPPGDLTLVLTTFGCQSQGLRPVDPGYGQLGTLYTVDQNGNVTSQTADTGAEISWTGQWYDPPPTGSAVSAVTLAALNWGFGAAAFAFGSPSKNGTATDRCPALDSTSNGLIEQGSLSLNTYLLHNPCPFCIANIFIPLHTSQAEFTTYLLQGNSLPGQHRFCDGTKSMEPWATVDPQNVIRISVKGVIRAPNNVGEYFQANPGQITAITAPKTAPLYVFFDPSLITNNLPYNESLVFHEGLHGSTGVGDGSALFGGGLCGILGIANTKGYSDCYTNTNQITIWIENNVFTPQ